MFLNSEKCYIFAYSITWIWLGVNYSNKPGPEMDYFYGEVVLKVTFGTAPKNRKPQMTSSGTYELGFVVSLT